MTKRQRKICKNILRYKNLNKVLQKCKISDYIEIQDILGPGNLDFSDNEMDENTELFLEDALIEELERHRWTIFRECFTWLLSLGAIIISIIALFRS